MGEPSGILTSWVMKIKILRAVVKILRGMRKDGFEGSTDEVLAELLERLQLPAAGLGEIDWQVIIDLIIELLPVILKIIALFF